MIFRIVLPVFSLAFLVFALLFSPRETYTECSNSTASATYQHQYAVNEFVILYDSKGQHRIVNQSDATANQVPDIVENIAIQLVTMQGALSALGFRHPFDQYRYDRVGVDRIYVAIRSQDGRGAAFDPSHRDISRGNNGPCVLLIKLSNELKTGNITPAHELFHLYQYGYTIFKNSWYLEGMARWAEGLLQPRQYPKRPIPDSVSERKNLFSQSYEAVSFWMAIVDAHPAESEPAASYPIELLERRYVNGEPVIDKRHTTKGAATMIQILEAFDRLDQQISRETGRDVKSWNEAQRRDYENNSVMLEAVLQIIESNQH